MTARSTIRYRLRRGGDRELLDLVRELAARHRRFGYRKIGILLRRDGLVVNHKRLFRVYKADGLGVPRRRKRHVRYECDR